MAIELGIKLGSYEICAPLGASRMGEVYLAEDRRLAFVAQLPPAITSEVKTGNNQPESS